jgi:hypothetical protein
VTEPLDYASSKLRRPATLWWVGRVAGGMAILCILICLVMTWIANWAASAHLQGKIDETRSMALTLETCAGIILSLAFGFLFGIISLSRTSTYGIFPRWSAIVGIIFPFLFCIAYNRVANVMGLHFHPW